MIVYQPNNSFELEVLLENETVWLSLEQIGKLFDRDRSVISKHVKNIFSEGELIQNSVCANFARTAADGKIYRVEYFNLDVIISVGYRVKSRRGTQFRQWANKVLRDYLLKGHAIHQRFERIEGRVAETEKKIDFFVRTSLPPVQGVFYEGQIFDAHAFVSDLIRSAKRSVILIDNYADESVLTLLSKRMPNVTADIHTGNVSKQMRLDLRRHNEQYAPVTVHETGRFHDRFLIIDSTVFHIGASFKDLGRKLFAFSRMEISDGDLLKGK
jgi:hypothetical protein